VPRRTRQRHLSCSPLMLAGIFFCQSFFWIDTAGGQAAPVSNPLGNIELRMNDVKINTSCDELRRLVVTVLNDDKAHLDRQAVVKVRDRKRDITTWQTTSNESEITFCNIDFGDYEVETSAVGYLTDHQQWHLGAGIVQQRQLQITLRKDPTAVELFAHDDAVPLGVRKDVKRAVAALKSANLKHARKRLDKAYKVAPSSAQVNFLYGYLFVQLRDFEKAESYLSRAATLDARMVQALTLLGRVQLQLQHYEDACRTLEQAVQADSGYWMAHNLLADAYLRRKEYEKARQQAQLAIDDSRGAGNVAQLVLGQALANVGRDQEGIQALKIFVQTNPDNPAIPQVKALIAQIANRDSETTEIRQFDADLALAASEPSLPESAWGPPGVDDVKPPVASGVTCPYQQVLEASGERVKQLVENITKFAAVEDLVHEQLDKVGNPITKETRKFNYVASITEEHSGFLKTDEFRDLRYGVTDLPDGIVTTGFVTLALIFHPDMRENFQMSCEGLGDWRGQSAWLVYFRQRDDKPSRFADYVAGSRRYPMKLKGRAWITTDNLQIVRIESDLAGPLPRLSVQHQIAEYGPVRFAKKNVDLWLPQNVDIFLELNRHHYYRRHSFDHYMLFSVASEDKPALPKNAPPSGPIQNP
jgi:tetratricopeptide (TPR) repeat protein